MLKLTKKQQAVISSILEGEHRIRIDYIFNGKTIKSLINRGIILDEPDNYYINPDYVKYFVK